MTILALILNFLGAILLVIGAAIQTKVLSEIIDVIADQYGTFGMSEIPKTLISKFRNQRNFTNALNYSGYILFILGFGLQLLNEICLVK